MGRKSAPLLLLSWMPFIGKYFSIYVLSDVPGKKPLHLTNKVIISDRLLSFWIYVGIKLFGPALITTFIFIVGLFPIIGQIIGSISAFLYLVPVAAAAWIEYAYITDVLNIFNLNHSSNRKTAIVIAILDAVVTFGFARAFYLYTIMNKEPLVVRYENSDQIK